MTIKFMFNFPNDANHTYMLVQIKSGIPNLWRRYYRAPVRVYAKIRL